MYSLHLNPNPEIIDLVDFPNNGFVCEYMDCGLIKI